MKVGQTRHSSNSSKVRMEVLLSKYFLVPSIFWDDTKACKLTKPKKICKAEQDPHLWIWSDLPTLPQFRNISLPPPAGDDGERLVEDTKGNSEGSKDGEKGKLDRNSGRTARVTSSAEAPEHHVGLLAGWHVALFTYFVSCTPPHCWYCSVGVSEHDAVLLPVYRHHADQLSHGGGVGETVARRKEPGWWGAIDKMASTLLLTTYILYTRSTHATASFCPFLSSSSAMFALAEKRRLPRHDVPECFCKWDSDPAKNGTCRQCV